MIFLFYLYKLLNVKYIIYTSMAHRLKHTMFTALSII